MITMNDPELVLRRYINIRSNHLGKIFALVFIVVTVTVFLLLWNEAVLYPITTHLDYIVQIIKGSKSIGDYIQILDKAHLLPLLLENLIISIPCGVLAGLAAMAPWFKRPDRMTWLHVLEGVHVFNNAREGVKALTKKLSLIHI